MNDDVLMTWIQFGTSFLTILLFLFLGTGTDNRG